MGNEHVSRISAAGALKSSSMAFEPEEEEDFIFRCLCCSAERCASCRSTLKAMVISTPPPPPTPTPTGECHAVTCISASSARCCCRGDGEAAKAMPFAMTEAAGAADEAPTEAAAAVFAAVAPVEQCRCCEKRESGGDEAVPTTLCAAEEGGPRSMPYRW